MEKINFSRDIYKLFWKEFDYPDLTHCVEVREERLFLRDNSLLKFLELPDYDYIIYDEELKYKFEKFNSEISSNDLKIIHFNLFITFYKLYNFLSLQIKTISKILIWYKIPILINENFILNKLFKTIQLQNNNSFNLIFHYNEENIRKR
ncbi:hypothetical protein [Empedobacter falsenii]